MTTIPSTTRVLILVGEVMTTSYRYLPGDILAVLAAVMEIVSSPFATPVTDAVKLVAVVE
jgi:hypothetical protein